MAFSLTVPLTRVAVGGGSDAMPVLFVGAGRAVVAAVLATLALSVTRQRFPRGYQWSRVAVVACGVVLGFPLLTSVALRTLPASHGAVVIGLLPAVTAVCAVLRVGERPGRLFWAAALGGACAAVAFTVVQGGFGGVGAADLLLFGAVLAAAIGYAEGGLLARELGAWQTVSWALVLSAPVMSVLTWLSVDGQMPHVGVAAWSAFAYLGVVSMFLGFFAWYRGLAIGPMARVSQVQLVQPVLTIGWAMVLLGERITWQTALGGGAVVSCALLAVRTRAGRIRLFRANRPQFEAPTRMSG